MSGTHLQILPHLIILGFDFLFSSACRVLGSKNSRFVNDIVIGLVGLVPSPAVSHYSYLPDAYVLQAKVMRNCARFDFPLSSQGS
jgi:hypothetical protein